jgi:Phosphotransferase enzyme family
MASQEKFIEELTYRLILMLPGSRKILILETGNSHCFPSVRILKGTRIARELQRAVQETWELDVIVLDLPKPVGSDDILYAVAEVRSSKRPFALRAIDIAELKGVGLNKKLRGRLVSVSEGDAFPESFFSRIGWIDQSIDWVETETGKRTSSKSQVEQYNTGENFSLVRFRMEDESEYWLKATGEPNTHELAVTCLLSRLAEGYLPRVISTRPAWNAWLMSGAIAPEKERQTDPFQLLGNAVESMAALQFKTVGHRSILLAVGAFDQSMPVFQKHSEALFDFLEEAMLSHLPTKAARLDVFRLREVRRIFEDTSRRMEDLDLPQTIVHGDMNRENILTGSGQCQFLDWCEAYVGCPFITLQHLLLLNQDGSEGWAPRDAALKDRYKRVWLRVCNEAAINKGFVYMQLLAIASTLYGRCNWFATSARENSGRQVYARNLVRHLDRAARSPELLDALRCRSMLGVVHVGVAT